MKKEILFEDFLDQIDSDDRERTSDVVSQQQTEYNYDKWIQVSAHVYFSCKWKELDLKKNGPKIRKMFDDYMKLLHDTLDDRVADISDFRIECPYYFSPKDDYEEPVDINDITDMLKDHVSNFDVWIQFNGGFRNIRRVARFVSLIFDSTAYQKNKIHIATDRISSGGMHYVLADAYRARTAEHAFHSYIRQLYKFARPLMNDPESRTWEQARKFYNIEDYDLNSITMVTTHGYRCRKLEPDGDYDVSDIGYTVVRLSEPMNYSSSYFEYNYGTDTYTQDMNCELTKEEIHEQCNNAVAQLVKQHCKFDAYIYHTHPDGLGNFGLLYVLHDTALVDERPHYSYLTEYCVSLASEYPVENIGEFDEDYIYEMVSDLMRIGYTETKARGIIDSFLKR